MTRTKCLCGLFREIELTLLASDCECPRDFLCRDSLSRESLQRETLDASHEFSGR